MLTVRAVAAPQSQGKVTPSFAKTAGGELEGVVSADGKARTYKGIPYVAPPVGALRWKSPQPAPAWTGIRKAVEYGPRCMQGRVFDDMIFHDDGPSEDRLYLNLWMPAKPEHKKLPVIVWIYGGALSQDPVPDHVRTVETCPNKALSLSASITAWACSGSLTSGASTGRDGCTMRWSSQRNTYSWLTFVSSIAPPV